MSATERAWLVGIGLFAVIVAVAVVVLSMRPVSPPPVEIMDTPRLTSVIGPRAELDLLATVSVAAPAKLELLQRPAPPAEVELRLCIDAQGVPERVEVLRSSGNAEIDEQLRRQLERWRYEPGPGCSDLTVRYRPATPPAP
jgi:TonB family protein